MVEIKDFSEELNEKIEGIQKKVYSGEITLLNLELVPIFNSLKNSVTVNNIDRYSKPYREACGLLDQKFNELKKLLGSSTIEKTFLEYLESNPKDEDIVQLFDNCWRSIFYLDTLSIHFLELSKNLLCREKENSIIAETIEMEESDEEFVVKIPKHKFTEKMMNYFLQIKEKLPCSFDTLFEDEENDISLCKNFVYILHLLQSGFVKYQEETNFIYLEEVE
jgi:hypothetical protein